MQKRQSLSTGGAAFRGSGGGPALSCRLLCTVVIFAVAVGCGAREEAPADSAPKSEPQTQEAGLESAGEPPAAVSPADPADAASDAPTLQETVTHEAMGTELEFTLYAREGDEGTGEILQIADQAFQAVDDLEQRVSRWNPKSQTSYINNHAAEEPVRVAPDILDMILFAQNVHGESGGAFDPTVGPLIELWGFYRGEGRLPTEAELSAALDNVGFDKVKVDEDEWTVAFSQEGVRLDFGGIAKGLALDLAAQVLSDNGVTSGVLHAGTSTVLTIGAPPGESGWTVRIRDPYNEMEYIDEVILHNESLSTSGSYEKFFKLDGKEYCHIFDPRTGKPVEGMLSATAIAPNGTSSDALSTAFFVMGADETRDYCRAHPEVRAILVEASESGEPEPLRINFAEKE
jgi:thiamine biosynthesis lipoprotein